MLLPPPHLVVLLALQDTSDTMVRFVTLKASVRENDNAGSPELKRIIYRLAAFAIACVALSIGAVPVEVIAIIGASFSNSINGMIPVWT